MSPSPDAIIMGAGPAGLACAMTMRGAGLRVAVLEKADSVGSVWRRHYDRLHLHTDREHSGLPGMAMPRTYPLYPSRQQVVEYLENYAARFDIRPVFNTTVCRLWRESGRWCAETAARLGIRACRGGCDRPRRCAVSPLLARHRSSIGARSSTAANIAIRRRMPESACWWSDLAIPAVRSRLISPSLASMSRFRFAARCRSCHAILGFPILTWAIFYQYLPARLVDRINAPILRLALGRSTNWACALRPRDRCR